MPNSKSKVSTHNKNILNKPVNQNTRKCNFINKNAGPLNGICLLENILYIATTNSDKKNCQLRNYIGISENTHIYINKLVLCIHLRTLFNTT